MVFIRHYIRAQGLFETAFGLGGLPAQDLVFLSFFFLFLGFDTAGGPAHRQL